MGLHFTTHLWWYRWLCVFISFFHLGWIAPTSEAPMWAVQWCPSIPAWAQHDWRDSAGIPVYAVSQEPSGLELEKSATTFLGVPYVWGGNTEDGIDCSGFTNNVYAKHGYDLPRTAREQYKVGLEIPQTDLDRGDLIFFTSQPGDTDITHVGMYLSDGEFIHAARGKGQVTFDRLSTSYYKQRYMGGRRMLALPVGRYSTLWGAARKGYFAKTPMELAMMPPSNLPPSADEVPDTRSIERILIETDEETRPVMQPRSLSKGAITRVGASAMIRQATEVNLKLGYANFSNTSSFFITPQFTYFNHANALLASIAVPLQLPVEGQESVGKTLHSNWNTPREIARIIREVNFGQKETNLYIDLSRTLSNTLGHGHLMRMMTPNFFNQGLPAFPIGTEALSLALDGSLKNVGGELFMDDLFKPRVLGALVFTKPWAQTNTWNILKEVSLGLNYVTDIKAPVSVHIKDPQDTQTLHESVHGMSLSAETKLVKSETVNVKFYSDFSSLFNQDFGGFGNATGLLLRSNLGAQRNHILRLVAETRFSGAHFIPSYFGINYSLVRDAAPDDRDTATKPMLDRLKLLTSNAARIGFYGLLSYQWHRKISTGIAYDNEWSTSDDTSAKAKMGQNLMFFFNLENIMLPGRRMMHLHVAYHLRNFNGLTPMFSQDRNNEFIFTSLGMDITRYLSIAGSLRKALADQRDTPIEGGFYLIGRYEI